MHISTQKCWRRHLPKWQPLCFNGVSIIRANAKSWKVTSHVRRLLVNKSVFDMSRFVTIVMNFTFVLCTFDNMYVVHKMFNMTSLRVFSLCARGVVAGVFR